MDNYLLFSLSSSFMFLPFNIVVFGAVLCNKNRKQNVIFFIPFRNYLALRTVWLGKFLFKKICNRKNIISMLFILCCPCG